MRPVVNVVRGQRVPDAINALNFMPQKVTDTVRRTIWSAVHNLMDKYQEERFDENELVVQEIRVDEGPHFKRFRPAPRGRAQPILKRTSHLTVVVGTTWGDEDQEDED
jgi:large subunit ribosomal protein L22